jgi:ABC-2 type transport system ATP-binding protein
VAARNVDKRFGRTQALSQLTLSVQPGELYGLLGPDGAGKTTAIRALAGLIDIDAGEVSILGQSPFEGKQSVREGLGLMPQQFSLYRDLTVAEHLRFFARLYALSPSEFASRSSRLLSITRLERFVDRRADALSGGMYKKLALSCALLHEPRALLLDEPTNGVDPVSRRELWALLHEFVEEGMAVLVSTPYMDEADRCSRVGILHQGQLLLEGEPRALLSQLEVEAYDVLSSNRDEAEAILSEMAEVKALSPSGSALRMVVTPKSSGRVLSAIQHLGAEARRVSPAFEDLFLILTQGKEEEARDGQ